MGKTPVTWLRNFHQRTNKISTNGVECNDTKIDIEEVISLHCVLHCLSMKVSDPNNIFG